MDLDFPDLQFRNSVEGDKGSEGGKGEKEADEENEG